MTRIAQVLFLLSLACTRASAAPARLIAVLPLDTTKAAIDDATRQSLEEAVRTVAGDAASTRGWTVLTGDTTLAVLADNGVDGARTCEASCALEAARELKAGVFLSGSVARTEGALVAFLRVFESTSGRQLASVQLEGGTVRELRKQFEAKAPEVFGRALPEAERGAPEAPAGPAMAALLPDLPPLDAVLRRPAKLDVQSDVFLAQQLALGAEAAGVRDPEAAAKAWEALAQAEGDNPYREAAKARAAAWRELGRRKTALSGQRGAIDEKLGKVLALETIEAAQKQKILEDYARTFGIDAALPLVARVQPVDQRVLLCRELAKGANPSVIELSVLDAREFPASGKVAVDGTDLGYGRRFEVPRCASRLRVTSSVFEQQDVPLALEAGVNPLEVRFGHVESNTTLAVFAGFATGLMLGSEVAPWSYSNGTSTVWTGTAEPSFGLPVGLEFSVRAGWKWLHLGADLAPTLVSFSGPISVQYKENDQVVQQKSFAKNLDASHWLTRMGLWTSLLVPVIDRRDLHVSVGPLLGVQSIGMSDYGDDYNVRIDAEVYRYGLDALVESGWIVANVTLAKQFTAPRGSFEAYSSSDATLTLETTPLLLSVKLGYRFLR